MEGPPVQGLKCYKNAMTWSKYKPINRFVFPHFFPSCLTVRISSVLPDSCSNTFRASNAGRKTAEAEKNAERQRQLSHVFKVPAC